MSFGISATAWSAIAMGVMAAASTANAVQAQQAGKRQKNAANDARAAAERQAGEADMAFNAANRKKPDIGAMLASNALVSQAGNAGTMLTGPGGAPIAQSLLGRTTLLGG